MKHKASDGFRVVFHKPFELLWWSVDLIVHFDISASNDHAQRNHSLAVYSQSHRTRQFVFVQASNEKN